MKNRALHLPQFTQSLLPVVHWISLIAPERLFLILALTFGPVFLLLSAPFQSPDEYVHFYRAYQISRGTLTGTQAVLPESVYNFSVTVSNDLVGNEQNKQSKKALVEEVARPFSSLPEVEISIATTAIYSPLPYLPQSIGILLGRLLNLPPIFIFYLGRLFNLMVWIFLTYFAVCITPIHPRLFVAIALMPMALFQAASNSPDALTNAISLLFVALVLRIIFNQQTAVQWKDWLMAGMMIIALSLCKSIYLLLGGLLLLAPIRQFRQQRAILPLTIAILVLGIVSGVAWLQISLSSVSVQTMNELQTPTVEGVRYVLRNPGVAIPIFWRTILTYGDFQIRSFIGILGWVDTVLPGWVYPLYYALLLFIIVFEPHPQAFLTIFERFWMVALALGAGMLMMMTFFYPQVSVGNGILGPIQGRYYIPFAPLYFLPFSQRKWSLPSNSPAWFVVAGLHVLVLVVTIRALLWRYYAI